MVIEQVSSLYSNLCGRKRQRSLGPSRHAAARGCSHEVVGLVGVGLADEGVEEDLQVGDVGKRVGALRLRASDVRIHPIKHSPG